MTTPLHISRLVIDNFRGIDHLDLSFDYSEEEGGLAVLAGDNGCGKTTVLEAILLLLYRSDLFQSDKIPIDEQVRFGQQDFRIEAFEDDVTLRCVSLDGFPVTRDEQGWARRKPHVMPGRFEVAYFASGRGDSATQPASSEAESLDSLKRRLINVYNRSARQGSRADSPFARTQRAMQRFLGHAWTMDVLFVDDRNDAEPEIVFRNGDLPTEIISLAAARKAALQGNLPQVLTLDQLSSGQRALFSFVGPLIFRAEDSFPLVLIDEPERHLHPSWQRVLLAALRELSPRSQFIVATHSLEILDSAMSHERHLLLRDDDPRARSWRPEHREAGE